MGEHIERENAVVSPVSADEPDEFDERERPPRRQRRERVTPDEAEARIGAAVRAVRTSPRTNMVIQGVFIAAVLMVCAVLIGGMARSRQDSRARLATADEKVGSQEGRLQELEAALAAVPTEEAAAETLESAADTGAAIAKAQNVFIDADPNEYELLSKTAAATTPFFSERSVSGGGLDPRQPWYRMKDPKDGSPAGTSRYEWEFVSTYDFVGGDVRVVWLNRDKSNGKLLAWTMATYEASTGTMGDVSTGVTGYGTRSEGSSADNDPGAPAEGYLEPDYQEGDS